MSKILAIDPGLRGCGVAYLFNGGLSHACYVRNPEQVTRGPSAWVSMALALKLQVTIQPSFLVLEIMRINLDRHRSLIGSEDPADVLECQGVQGAIAATIFSGGVVGFLAKEWKGQVPKDVHNDRVLRDLHPEEHEAIQWPAKSLAHNVIDAIGLGLFFARRVGERRVSPGSAGSTAREQEKEI